MVAEEIKNTCRECLTESERNAIISRIHSFLYWVGMFIPEQELVGGRQVNLRDVVYNFISKEKPTPEEVQGARDLANMLEKKARELEKEIKEQDVTRTHAYQLLDEICGLLRAVDELRSAKGKTAEFKRTSLMAKVNDEKRWLQFVEHLKIK